MNIFLTSKNPEQAAQHLDDLRLNKMIIETAQLLSGAYRHLFGDNELLYKTTHINHCCAIWARKDINNWCWLYLYFACLNSERKARFLKDHLSYTKLFNLFHQAFLSLNHKLSDPVFDFNCSGFEDDDLTECYQKCLIRKWNNDKRPPRWTNRDKPYFYNDLKNHRLVF